MKNTIYLNRKNKVFLKSGDKKPDSKYVLALIKNIESLGYSISKTLAECLSTLSEEQISDFYKELISDLKKMVGANVKFKPMYPNFPKQVEEIPKEILFNINALHYLGDWVGVRMMPEFVKKIRPVLKEKTPIKIIDLGTENEFETIFTDLLSSKASLSQDDKKDLFWFIKNYSNDLDRFLPECISHKENLAYISGLLLRHTTNAVEIVSAYIKTATDILRLATALSEGDISLSTNTKFRSFRRLERRFLLALLEKCHLPVEDMLRHKNRWTRLGERLHPSEYKKYFPKSCKAFDLIRNNKPVKTFNGILERYIESGDFLKAADYLKKRPGEFARRLDHFLRSTENSEAIVQKFKEIIDQISTNVLLQLFSHFKDRNVSNKLRVFFPKGNVAKAYAIPNKIKKLDKQICKELVQIIRDSLIKKFSALEALGDVYIDPKLKNYIVPLSQRSASKSLKSLAIGSRLDLPKDANVIRFFLVERRHSQWC